MESLGLTGHEVFDITGLGALNEGEMPERGRQSAPATSPSPHGCGSTPRWRPPTSATAGSSLTCSASSLASWPDPAAQSTAPLDGSPSTITTGSSVSTKSRLSCPGTTPHRPRPSRSRARRCAPGTRPCSRTTARSPRRSRIVVSRVVVERAVVLHVTDHMAAALRRRHERTVVLTPVSVEFLGAHPGTRGGPDMSASPFGTLASPIYGSISDQIDWPIKPRRRTISRCDDLELSASPPSGSPAALPAGSSQERMRSGQLGRRPPPGSVAPERLDLAVEGRRHVDRPVRPGRTRRARARGPCSGSYPSSSSSGWANGLRASG